MFQRLLNFPSDRSCFLFGARGTGKSTLLRATLPQASTVVFNLLEADTEDRLARDPRALEWEVLALAPGNPGSDVGRCQPGAGGGHRRRDPGV